MCWKQGWECRGNTQNVQGELMTCLPSQEDNSEYRNLKNRESSISMFLRNMDKAAGICLWGGGIRYRVDTGSANLH